MFAVQVDLGVFGALLKPRAQRDQLAFELGDFHELFISRSNILNKNDYHCKRSISPESLHASLQQPQVHPRRLRLRRRADRALAAGQVRR